MDIQNELQDREAMKRCNYLVNQLYSERSKYEPVWKQLSDYIYPMRGRFSEEEGSREGSRRDRCLVDPFPMDAVNKHEHEKNGIVASCVFNDPRRHADRHLCC